VSACDDCLRRSWLLGRLSGHLDKVRGERLYIREVLALSDADLVAALAGEHRRAIADEHAVFRTETLRAAVDGAGQRAICRHDPVYPGALNDLPDRPAVLFVAGGDRAVVDLALFTAEPFEDPAVAVVGARRASGDARRMAEALGRELSFAGVPVISGMALGVDAWAHRGALIGGGRTIAVLGCGADVVYPRTEAGLYRELVAEGVVLSELPPGTPVRRWTFPARNRIIAALATMTVVVEAAERSGSLITATLAESLGREVGAVPGRPMVTGTRGTNGLLRQGCAVIRDAQDVLDQLFGAGGRETVRTARDPADLDPDLRAVFTAVAAGRDTIAELCEDAGQVRDVTARLGELEFLGYLRRAADGRYVTLP
jgi:DNA processing protein